MNTPQNTPPELLEIQDAILHAEGAQLPLSPERARAELIMVLQERRVPVNFDSTLG